MGLHVETGQLTPTPDSVQPSPPATFGQPVRVPVASGPADSAPLLGGEMPTTAMFAEQAAAGTADCAAAMSAGMSAENDRRDHYHQDILPLGAQYGDQVTGMPTIDPPWETPYFPETNQATA